MEDGSIIDSSKSAKYNDGLLQIQRLDNWIKIIAECDENLQGFNPRTGDFNYKLKFISLNCQITEIWDKLNPKQKEDVEKARLYLKKLLKDNPPVVITKEKIRGMYKQRVIIYEVIWNEFVEKLLKYQRYIKQLMSKHGFSSPDRDEDEGMF